ncbi:hypothetical protein DY000_02035014 [Brassica cretica]|uniref:F-box associated beta-propeller type 3 domain-containing protein n=1 Tax=Brassica cretica TaxID=69181 RepID=A0ABQ7DTR4_BRACR|nr:hypothetical protein DY000_02035014 [Brassica cretica]
MNVLTFSPPVTPSSLSIPDDLVLEIFSRLPLKAITRCRCLLFACKDDSKLFFFSSPQPENPEENSYVVAANHLARFPCSDRFSAPTSGFFSCYGFSLIMNCELENVICNPSTGQSLTLPPILKSRKGFGVESYLGY